MSGIDRPDGSIGDNRRRVCLPGLRKGHWLIDLSRVRVGFPVQLLAFVTLETPLLHKPLSLLAQLPIISVGEFAFLRLVDRMPRWTDIGAASQANLATRHQCGWRCVTVAIDNIGSVSSIDSREAPACCWRGGCWRRHLGGNSDLVCLPRAPGKCKIGLFEVLDVELKHVHAALFHHVMHLMHLGLWCMFFTPDRSCHDPAFPIERDGVELVTPGTLDGSDVEAQDVAGLMGAFNVD